MVPVVDEDPLAPSALPTPDSWTWFTETGKTRAPAWRNEVTLRTVEMLTRVRARRYIEPDQPDAAADGRGRARPPHAVRPRHRGLRAGARAQAAGPAPGRPLRRLRRGSPTPARPPATGSSSISATPRPGALPSPRHDAVAVSQERLSKQPSRVRYRHDASHIRSLLWGSCTSAEKTPEGIQLLV